MISIVLVPKCLILQLAESRRDPAVEKNRKCKRAAIRSRQRPGSVPALERAKKLHSVHRKRFFFFPQNGFEAQALGVETNQPPSALNAPPFLVWQARGASSDFFFAVRTLGTGEPQTTSADWFGAHPKLKLPFLGGAYSI